MISNSIVVHWALSLHVCAPRGTHLFSSMGGDDEGEITGSLEWAPIGGTEVLRNKRTNRQQFRRVSWGHVALVPGILKKGSIVGLQWPVWLREGVLRRSLVRALRGTATLLLALGSLQLMAQFADPATATAQSATAIPRENLILPEALSKLLARGVANPLVLQVGSHVMYSQAHIRGAKYAGPGSTATGLRLLEDKVAGLSKSASILLYCGCCPWDRCPNAGAAFHHLHELGYSNVKVLFIAHNFGADWVQKVYSIETGD
jgi:thiosulfate/3-mercaptopyruvate sulfurtransferase